MKFSTPYLLGEPRHPSLLQRGERDRKEDEGLMGQGEGSVSVGRDVVKLNFYRGQEMVIVVSVVVAVVVVVCVNV